MMIETTSGKVSRLVAVFARVSAAYILFVAHDVTYASSTFQYDSLHRLTQIQRDDGTIISYTYDELGNRTRKQVLVPPGVGSPTWTATPTATATRPTQTPTPTNTGPTATRTSTPTPPPTSVGGSPTATSALPRPVGPCLWVANSDGGNLSVIDTATDTLVNGPIPVAAQPRGIAFTSDGRYAYVTHLTSGTVSVIDSTTGVLAAAPITVGAGPRGIAMTPAGVAYVANSSSNNVSVINSSTNAVIATVGVGTTPWAVAITPNGSFAYVTNSGSNNVSVIGTASNAVVATVPVGQTPRGIAMTQQASQPVYAFVTGFASGNITRIDTTTHTVSGSAFSAGGSFPAGITLTSGSNLAYVANASTTNNVGVVNTSTGATVTTLATGGSNGTAILALATTRGGRAYVTDITANTVAEVNTDTNQVVGTTISVRTNPQALAAVANNCPVFVPTCTPTPMGGLPTATPASPLPCDTYAVLNTIANVSQPVWLSLNGGKLFATSGNRIHVIDTGSDTPLTDITLSAYPGAYANKIAFLGSKGYVALSNLGSSGHVGVIDTSANTVTAYISVNGGDSFGAEVYDGKVYVAHPTTVDVIDPCANTVSATISTGAPNQSGLNDITVVPALARAYTLNQTASDLTVIDLTTNTAGGTVSLPIEPSLSVLAAGKIYVSGKTSGTPNGEVVSVDPSDNSVGVPISTGLDTLGIGAVGSRLFAVSADAAPYNTLVVIDIDSGNIVQTLTVGENPTGLVADPSTGKVYVANQTDNSISVIGCVLPTATATPSATSISVVTATPTPTQDIGVSPTWTATGTPGGTATETPVTTSTPQGVCPQTPMAQCRTPARSLFQLRKGLTDVSKNRLIWKWKGAATSQAEFADPTTTADYALCIYASNAVPSLVAQATIAADANNWSELSTKGYKYKELTGTAYGITKILLKGSEQDATKVLVKGSGGGLPDVPLSAPEPVTVNLVNTGTGLCWSSSYAGADILRNDIDHFKAKSQ